MLGMVAFPLAVSLPEAPVARSVPAATSRIQRATRAAFLRWRAAAAAAALGLAILAPIWQLPLAAPDQQVALSGSGAAPVSLLALAAVHGPAAPGRALLFLLSEVALLATLLFARRFGTPSPSKQDEVLQTVSHDLRAPLNATEGYIKYLMGCEPGTLNAEQLELLNTALANLNRLEHFVTDMLDLARLDAGRMPYRIETGDVAPAAYQVLQLFRFTAQERGVQLANHLPERLPLVLVDSEKLTRILTNLVSNALKFTDEGGRVTVLASRLDGELVLTVADTGIGMSAATVAGLFERFTEPRTVPGRPRGAGLGLWIVKSLVEGHGGRVWVESTPGVGTRFHFTLPLA